MDYIFMTDSNSDIPFQMVEERNIPIVYMPYILEGKEYYADLGRDPDNSKSFYDKMRAGATPVTSLLPTPIYLEYFEPLLKEKDILFLAFSSKLSNTIQNIYQARDELLQKYPERKFIVVDTLSISAPQTLLILKAHDMYREGKSMEEVAQWVEDNKLRAQAYFMVDDLKYLKRGGRISGTAAALGTMLDLRPILVESKEGGIVAAEKVRGRKAALRTLTERTVQNLEDPEQSTVMIIHADAPEEAQRLEASIRERIPSIKEVLIAPVGAVIGTHCGPGTVASCFIGKERSL